MIFELWSESSGNCLGAFSTERQALIAVRRAARRNGAKYVEGLFLVSENSRGQSRLIADGEGLIRRL